MALSENAIQVQWASGNNTIGLAPSGATLSDVISFSANAFAAALTAKCDSNHTPTSGDTQDWYIQRTTGDPDGSGTHEYPTDADDGQHVLTTDMNAQDPSISTVDLPLPVNSAKLYVLNNGATYVTISANIMEKTA